MSDHPTPTAPAKPQQTEEERARALRDAGIELGQAIALGLVPYLAQAIDVYDTVESLWALHGAETEPAKEEAKFDLILALIGWIPGPGDGVKKTLRLVNKEPERFAPILFDLLRKVLEICRIDTSPETLLDELFNASKLRADIDKIRQAIENSELFARLSPESQSTIKQGLHYVQAELPALIGIVERRLLRWKKLQPNSSARIATTGKHQTEQPDKRHAETGRQGAERAAHGAPGGVVNATLATEALDALQSKLIGVLGEHIADYHCLQHFGWGQPDWSGHDHGVEGRWLSGNPDDMREGKLSKGAAGQMHKLYKLDHSANPKGIDTVWRAMTHNGGKPYAVVEAKSELEIAIPKMLKKNPNFQPSMLSKLGITGIPKGEDMLEPYEDEPSQKTRKSKGGVKRGKESSSTATSSTGKARSGADAPEIMVQMSHEWIRKNMRKAVGDIARHILRVLPGGQMNYERHLLYTAQWMECAREHAAALLDSTVRDGSNHRNHHIPSTGIYNEQQVRDFVNRKKASLRKKYGDLPTLRTEP